ncbi:hypothetical protein ACHAW6_013436 [Cyclotella cf. meneghiniana]
MNSTMSSLLHGPKNSLFNESTTPPSVLASGNHSILFDGDFQSSSSFTASQPSSVADEATWDTKATILLAQGIFLTILVAVILCGCGIKHYHRMNLLRIQELTASRVQEVGRSGDRNSRSSTDNNQQNGERNLFRQILHFMKTPIRLLDNVINNWSSSPSTDYEYYNHILERMERKKEARRESVEERKTRLMNAFLKEQCVWEIREEDFIPPSSLQKHALVEEFNVNGGDNCNQADIENGLNIAHDCEGTQISEMTGCTSVFNGDVVENDTIATGSDYKHVSLGDESKLDNVDNLAMANDYNRIESEKKAQKGDSKNFYCKKPSSLNDNPRSSSSDLTQEASKIYSSQKSPSSASLDDTPGYLYINMSHSDRIRATNTGFQPTINSEPSSMPISFSSPSLPSESSPQSNSERPHTQTSNQRIIPNQCAICLCDYTIGDLIVLSPNKACPHVFHRECIVEWLVKMQDRTPCPCCRQPFIELENERMKSDLRARREMSEEELGRLRRHIQLGLQRGRAFDASVINFW